MRKQAGARQEMNQTFFRGCCLLISIGSISVALVYMFLLTRDALDFPSWSVLLYIFFFWFFWIYAKISTFSKALWAGEWIILPRLLLLFGCLAVFLLYFSLKQNVAGEEYGSRAPLMVILAMQYFLIGLICTFGDRFLGVFRKILKNLR